ncbi:hypothetical protein PENTCL1PPCAC_62, partial [Pristionchus entomophagus]
ECTMYSTRNNDRGRVSVYTRGRVSVRGSANNDRRGGNPLNARQLAANQSQVRNQANNAEIVSSVKVSKGSRYGSCFTMNALISHIEELRPIMPRMNHNGDFEFFVRDDDIAQALRAQSRRIKHTATGDRLNIVVRKTSAPWQTLTYKEKKAISEVVSNRADQQNRALELSGFATHEAFTTRDMMMNMTKNNVFLAVVELIESKYSDIVALSLKNNRIKYLEMASMLPYFAKNLNELDLSDNQIESISELEKLKGLRLTTLFLENNPVCEKYSKASDYLSAVQAIFPRITKLDGNDCSPLHTLDDNSEVVEPRVKPGFYGDAALRSIVETFIIEFFKAYDGDEPTTGRKSLMDVYADSTSQFTMCIENLYEEGSGKTRWPNDNFAFHIRLSHNIQQIEKWSKNRHNRLFHGAMDVVAQLCKMPATKHLLESFIVDVILSTPSLLIFSVQGLFEEAPFAVHPSLPQLNFFSRTFTVTPKANGSLCVISDELYLTAMTRTRVERYKIQLGKANAAPPAAAGSTVSDGLADAFSQLAQAAPAAADPAALATAADSPQAAMVASFCRDSGMLPEWSKLCLEEAEWNYEVASRNFLAAKATVPREAFAA